MLKKIEIVKEFGFGELESRLKKVRLKGFSDVRIYEDASISVASLPSGMIRDKIFVPQPTIYRNGFLDRLEEMRKVFSSKGIDIFRLNGGFDYVAQDEKGQNTDWTIIPPVVEVNPIHFNGGLDYSGFIGEALQKVMDEKGYTLNPELAKLNFPEYVGRTSLLVVCDGSHRIHLGLEKNVKQDLILVNAPKQGFPYYAAPKPYSAVHVEQSRPEQGSQDKTHVLTEPGHKLLYRLFPTGGILSGVVRPDKNDKN